MEFSLLFAGARAQVKDPGLRGCHLLGNQFSVSHVTSSDLVLQPPNQSRPHSHFPSLKIRL
jgi:hypothetical protein